MFHLGALRNRWELLDELPIQVAYRCHLHLLGCRFEPIGTLEHLLKTVKDEEVGNLWDIFGEEAINDL